MGFATQNIIWSSVAIGPDGTLYVGSGDNHLYAIEGSGGTADSPWPMFHHDLRHTGQAGPPCVLDLSASYADGTLSLDFELGTLAPVTWNIALSLPETGTIPLSSVPLPIIDPPVLIPVSIPEFPQMGVIDLLTTLRTAEKAICQDFAVVDTGTPGAMPTAEELQELFHRHAP